MEDLAPATDGRNPATLTTWDVKNPVNKGRSYQPQLVSRISFITVHLDGFFWVKCLNLVSFLSQRF